MPTTVHHHEDVSRAAKALKLADAFTKLASPTGHAHDVSPTAVVAFAEYVGDRIWLMAESLAGVRPASDTTRAVVLALLSSRARDEDPFEGF